MPACSLCCALCRARASQAQQLRAPAAHLSWYPASHTPELPHVVCLSRTQWCLCSAQHDSVAEWSRALASGASPQGRGLEPHSCQLAHKRQRAQLHVDRARSALLASSGSCPQQNKGEMCCLSVFYPGCLVDMSSPASMPAVVSSRKLQCCCCSSEHDSLAEWSKALASGASPQGRGLEPHSCQCSSTKLCGRVPDHYAISMHLSKC